MLVLRTRQFFMEEIPAVEISMKAPVENVKNSTMGISGAFSRNSQGASAGFLIATLSRFCSRSPTRSTKL